MDPVRYARHIALNEIGSEGQMRLSQARIAIIGVGGLGTPAALYLAASGIGTLGLIDHDHVSLNNLHRQILYETADLRRPKVEAAKDSLLDRNPEIAIHAIHSKLTADNAVRILSDYDVVLDGSDNVKTRYLVNDSCLALKKTLITAAIHRFEGQITTVTPSDPTSPCYRCLYPSLTSSDGPRCSDAGILGPVAGIVGCIQATEAIKEVLAIGQSLSGYLLRINMLNHHIKKVKLAKNPDCVCFN